jgi:hypothetical protein
LAVSNNVAIDATVCAVNPAHAAVFNIVDQIAAKVAKQWGGGLARTVDTPRGVIGI